MTAPQHTPGPWEVERLPASGRLAVTARQSHTVVVNHNVHVDEAVHAANAALIAAAPDLLAALEMVRDADEDAKRDGLPTIPAAARARIDAALAKATGNH